MAGKNQVTLTLVGDSTQLEKTFKRVGDASDKMAKDVKESRKSLDSAAEGFDKAETRAQGFRDGITGAQDTTAGFSALLKGDLQGGLLLLGSGLADTASTMANAVIPAIKATVARLGALKLAMIGIGGAAVIGVLALLAFSGAAVDAEDHTEELNKDLQVLAQSGVLTGRLRATFGENANAAEKFADKLRALGDDSHRVLEELKKQPELLKYLSNEQRDAVVSFEALDKALEDTIKSGANAAEVESALNDAFGKANVEAAIQAGLLPKYAAAAHDAAERGTALQDSVEASARQFRLAADALQSYTNLLKAQTDPVFGFVNAQNQVAEAQKRIFDLEAEHKRLPLEVAKAQEELNGAIKEYGSNSLEAAEARQALNDLTQKAADYDRDHETAVLDLAQAQLGLVDATSKLEQVNESELLPTLRQLRRDGYLSQEAFDALRNTLGQTQRAVNDLDGSRARIAVELQIQRLKNDYGYYEDYGTHVAGQQVASDIAGKFKNVPEFAMGGIVPGMPWQEVPAILHGGETVIPAGQSANGTTVIVYVDGVKAVQKYVKDNGGVVQEALGRRF